MITNDKKITIIVNQNPYHLNEPSISATEIRQLVNAADDYEVWKVVNSPDPEGQLPIDDILVTGSIEIKSGDRFRVVPPGTFGSQPAASQLLVGEVEDLKKKGIRLI